MTHDEYMLHMARMMTNVPEEERLGLLGMGLQQSSPEWFAEKQREFNRDCVNIAVEPSDK